MATTSIPGALEAPLSNQTLVGNLNVTLNGEQVASIGLYPETDIEETGLFGQLLDWIMLFFE